MFFWVGVDGRREQILANELPALAREVARVETVRAYAGEIQFLGFRPFFDGPGVRLMSSW